MALPPAVCESSMDSEGRGISGIFLCAIHHVVHMLYLAGAHSVFMEELI